MTETTNTSNEPDKIRLTLNDYEKLKFEASVLYIKQGLSQKQIAKQLNISEPTLIKWRKAGNWDALRPDFDVLNQFKAANMYITDGLTTGQIAMRLSITEITVKIWIYTYGWDASKNISQAQDVTATVVDDFCQYFKQSFPNDGAKMAMMRDSYLKTLEPKI